MMTTRGHPRAIAEHNNSSKVNFGDDSSSESDSDSDFSLGDGGSTKSNGGQKSLKERIGALSHVNKKLKEEIGVVKGNNDELKRKIDEVKGSNAELKRKLDDLQESHDYIQSIKSQLSSDLTNVTNELSNTASRLRGFRRDVVMIQQAHSIVIQAHTNGVTEAMNMEEEFKQLKKRHKEETTRLCSICTDNQATMVSQCGHLVCCQNPFCLGGFMRGDVKFCPYACGEVYVQRTNDDGGRVYNTKRTPVGKLIKFQH